MNIPLNKPGSENTATITLHLPLEDIVDGSNFQQIYTVILPDKPDMIPQKALLEESNDT